MTEDGLTTDQVQEILHPQSEYSIERSHDNQGMIEIVIKGGIHGGQKRSVSSLGESVKLPYTNRQRVGEELNENQSVGWEQYFWTGVRNIYSPKKTRAQNGLYSND